MNNDPITLDDLRVLRGEVHTPPRPKHRRRPALPLAAAELLAAGAVEIIERTTRTLVAEVEGRTGIRRHVAVIAGRWSCDCPGFVHRRRCAHLDAVKLIVAQPGYRRLKPEAASEPAGLDLTHTGVPA